MKLTKAKIKKMPVDPTVIELVGACLVAEAKAELTREKVDEYIKPLFDKFEFYVADKWKEKAESRDMTRVFGDDVADDGKILSDDATYLCDMEGETYLAYLAACRAAHLAGPFAEVVLAKEAEHGDDRGWCPALIAESAFREAKHKLANHCATEWLGLESIHYPHSDKLVKLVTGAVLAGPAGESLKSPVAIGV